MYGKTIAIFAAGFATGLLVLCVLLWTTGRLPIAKQQTVVRQIKIPAAELPNLSLADRIPKPEPAIIPPPVDVTPPAASERGTADRAAPDVPSLHLAMPIEGFEAKRLSDTFSDARDGRKHEALDIPAPRGTPIHAVAEGNVAKLFTSKQGGTTVYQFDDSGDWCYYYAHLDRYASGLKEGVLLRKGDVLGYVGTTGNAPPQTPHLHFAVFRLGPEKKWWQGQAIDPVPLFK